MRSRLGAVTVAALLLTFIGPEAQAAAPNAPVLVSPQSGSTTSGTSVPLSVNVSDPDGGTTDVLFEGREAGATASPPAAPFTLVAIPDTQSYTYGGRQAIMSQQTQWVVNSRSQLNTAMVVGLGDLVETYTDGIQWGYADSSQRVLDDAAVPNSVVPGNHDFNNDTGAFVQYDTYFPPSRYAGRSWSPPTASYGGYLGQNLFGADPVDRRNMDNFFLFTGGATDFLVLNLEWEAPQYALDWAAKVLAAYPDRVAILVTHSFLQISGGRNQLPQRVGGTSQTKLWTDFVAKQCSIKLVLAGHVHDGDLGEVGRTDSNQCGQPVHQLVTDYQSRVNGGDGWLRYYTFDPAADTVTAFTYSPTLNQYETDTNSAFTLPFALADAAPAQFTTIANRQVDSGGTASAAWTGLAPDTPYEWRAIASDGSSSIASPTWTFRTPPAGPLVDDTFSRILSGGWGSADASHAWAVKGPSASYSVDGSVGRASIPVGATRGGTLSGLNATNVRVTTELTVSPSATGSGFYVTVPARIAGSNSYRAKLRYLSTGAVQLGLARSIGTETTLANINVTGLTTSASSKLRLVFELEGTAPTTLRAKVWLAGGVEPSGWAVTSTDSTAALQVPGSAGIELYVSGSSTSASNASLDRYTVATIGDVEPPANQPPSATIATPTTNGLSVTLDGSGSTDPDGTIAAYAWNYGDNQNGTGATPTHTYSQAGTYTVTLQVTDDDGATNSTTRSVTVTAPVDTTLARDRFERTVANGWGSAELGGAWTSAGTATRYAVSEGQARHLLSPGGTASSTLAVSSTSAEVRLEMSWSRTAAQGALYASIAPRRVSSANDYRCNVFVSTTGVIHLSLVRRVNSFETTVSTAPVGGPALAANAPYRVACMAQSAGGTTQLKAKLWRGGTTEPGWLLSATDSTPVLQAAGGLGLTSYISGSSTTGVTVGVDNLTATTP